MNFIKSQLILLEKDDLLQEFKGNSFPKNIIIQNPFKGLVKFVESESDKLQILINATYNMDYYQSKDEVVKYNLNRNNNELNIKVMPNIAPSDTPIIKPSIPNSGSSSLSSQYEPDFLPLYLFASISCCMVILIMILSTLFVMWWNKHKRPDVTKSLHYKVDADSTKHPLLISEPNTPHIHDQIYGNFVSTKDVTLASVNSPDLTSGGNFQQIHLLDQSQPQMVSPLTIPASAIGASASSSSSLQPCNSSQINGGSSLDIQQQIQQHHQSNAVISSATGLAENMPFVLTGVFDDYPVQNLDLMTSINASSIGGTMITPTTTLACTDGTSYSTLPLTGFNLLYTSQANTQSMDRNPSLTTPFIDPNNTVAIAALAAASSNFTKPIITASNQTVSLPRHLSKDYLDDNFGGDRVGLNVLSQISEKDVADFNTPSYGGLNTKQCPLDNAGGLYQQHLNNTGQGSDETSGILSDSSGSTLDRPAQCSNAKISAGFSIVPSVISSNERYVSLDANDQRYVPLSNVMIAEVAQCPQHSYLVQTGNMPGNTQSGNTGTGGNAGVMQHGAIVHGMTDTSMDTTGQYAPMNMPDLSGPGSKQRTAPKPPKRDSTSTKSSSAHYYELGVNQDGSQQPPDIAEDDDSRTVMSSSPKSAMKGSRSNSRVSKQLRFTTLGLFGFLSCFLLGICVDPAFSANQSLNNNYNNYIHNVTTYYNIHNQSSAMLSSNDQTLSVPLDLPASQTYRKRPHRNVGPPAIEITVTVYVPRDIWKAAHFSDKIKNREKDKDSILSNKGLYDSFESFRLYFNESSSTKVDLGEMNRKYVEIYDIRNAFNIQSPSLCIQRYSCKHSCDPGNGHRCICQRGYKLDSSTDNVCMDIDECRDATKSKCSQMGGRCVNYPGSYRCLCGNSGEMCRDCNENCPVGYFKKASCHKSKYLQCQKCKTKCSSGYYIWRKCTEHSDTQCRACRPLCITGEYELSPCSGHSNRVCKTINSIPGILLPNKKNIWYEDRRGILDITHIISNDESKNLRTGRIINLERKSGYQIRLELLDAVTLEPLLEPVDHSSSNDNRLFLADPSNSTLRNFCPYPVPPKYSLNMIMHYNVTTDVVNDPELPGYRAANHPCKTYEYHGNYPDPIKSMADQFQKSVFDKTHHSLRPNVISCLDPGKLPEIFGDKFDQELAIRDGIYVEEKLSCSHNKGNCQSCLEKCAKTMMDDSTVCKPTDSAADNGRSPRLEMCFDCCAKDNCTSICEVYSKNNCAMHLCMKGPRMDLSLEPHWPTNDQFICHMKPSVKKPIIRFRWSILRNNHKITADEYEERMLFGLNKKSNKDSSQTSQYSFNIIQQVFRNLLHVTYSSNIDILPDIITGDSHQQHAALWNTERLPLATSSATLRPDKRSATIEVWPQQPLLVNSGMWGSSGTNYYGAPSNSFYDNTGYYGPLTSTQKQRSLDCRQANNLVELLNTYSDRFPSLYTNLGEVKVQKQSQHRYSVTSSKSEPRLNITIPSSASLIGAIFKLEAWVDRREGLSASLVYLYNDQRNDDDGVGRGKREALDNQGGYWIIDLTGQVNNFPGYFRLQLWDGDIQMTKSNQDPPSSSSSSPSSNGNRDSSNTRGYQPLLDYDIGVYEQYTFQLQLRIPAPDYEPNFDKTFLIRIIDSKGRLDVFVHRQQQDPEKIAQIERYSRSQSGKYNEEPPILPEVMAVSGEKSLRETAPLGIPKLVMFTVVLIIVVCLVLLLLGHLTRKEEHLCEDIVFKTRHLLVCVVYLTIKSCYCFFVTTTAVLILLVIYTREPYLQLTAQSTEYSNNSVAERLLMSRMDGHLEQEIGRQLEHVAGVKMRCDNRLKRYYEKLNKRLEDISAKAAKRRSRVLISQAVVERSQYELKNVVDELTRNLEDFNKTAKIYMKKIEHDMEMTKNKLMNTRWLQGARIIYNKVLAKRAKSNSDPDDPTKSFLSWLRITGELPSASPKLWLPSNIPLPDWSSMDIDVPVPREGTGLDAEYGPEYKPFSPKDKDLELEQSIWSYYEPPQDSPGGKSSSGSSSSSSSTNSDSNSDNNNNNGILYMESVEAIYNVLTQLTWHHLLAVTLLLDTLWLLHRAAHTVDTAEQIIYGYPCFIDCTAKGKRRRKRNENNFKFMMKRTFCEIMESTFVPKFCASAFALFILYLLSTHLNELISEEALDFVGYYDNMALPAHLRNRFVNTQLVQSAQQLNEYELSSYEQFVHQRQSEIQDILNSWVNWTTQLEQYQCDVLKHYKLTEDGKLISDILNKPNKVPIPTHCMLNTADRQREMEMMTDFKMSVCPVKLVIPQLFTEYNETEVSMQIVQSSRHWLKWTRQWVDVVLQCVFGFVAAIVLWNTVGAATWFFVKRFSVIRQKRIYETDFHALPNQGEDTNMKTSNAQ